MTSKKISVIMALLVLAIFAVGSVSAADDIATDSDVPADDISVDDVSADLTDELEETTSDVDADVADETENLRTTSYHVNNSMSLSTIQTVINNADDGSTIYFDAGTYTGVTLTLNKSNVFYSGYGATLIGTGTNHIFNLPNNLNNFTIAGFTLDINNETGKSSAIYGSFITNGVIANNTMYDGANGININKYYDNMTVENNIIYNMNNDGISFANPIVNSNITTLGRTYISGNNIQYCTYGIFIGGNFKGEITANYIAYGDYGIQFTGKPNGQMGNINATIYDNTIMRSVSGIDIVNMTIHYLKIDFNTIRLLNPSQNNVYTMSYNGNSSTVVGDFIVTRNTLFGHIKQSFINSTTEFDNYRDGTIDND